MKTTFSCLTSVFLLAALLTQPALLGSCSHSTIAAPGTDGSSAAWVKGSDSETAIACPDLASGETAVDCPWAAHAKMWNLMNANAGSAQSPTLNQVAPEIERQLTADSQSKDLIELWGKSLNFDEFAKGTIVEPTLLDAIFVAAKAPARNDKVVHAGTEHTYGYLFSLLKTPFGYKRARWVAPDFNDGFGLKENSLNPATKSGTLLSNVTAFFGRFAFDRKSKRDAVSLKKLNKVIADGSKLGLVSDEIRHLKLRKLPVHRLSEEFKVGTRTVKLRTDFVPFIHTPSKAGTNEIALIYSIDDSETPHPVLITVFSVTKDFQNKTLSADTLGENKPIQIRYNAVIPGISKIGSSGSEQPLLGRRTVEHEFTE